MNRSARRSLRRSAHAASAVLRKHCVRRERPNQDTQPQTIDKGHEGMIQPRGGVLETAQVEAGSSKNGANSLASYLRFNASVGGRTMR